LQLKRGLLVVPVLAGLALAGTAMARMLPAETVRDGVYQTCQRNGVHFNKQGHANCGLHKGWSEEGGDPSSESRGGDEEEQESIAPKTHARHDKHAKHEKHVKHEHQGGGHREHSGSHGEGHRKDFQKFEEHGHGSGKTGGGSHGKHG
jgi:hypothetical protein